MGIASLRSPFGQPAAGYLRFATIPARRSACGERHSLRTFSQSGGLAEAVVEDDALSTPNTPNLRPECHATPAQTCSDRFQWRAPHCWERRCPHRLRRASLRHRHGKKLTGHTALARAAEPSPEPIEYRRSQHGMPAFGASLMQGRPPLQNGVSVQILDKKPLARRPQSAPRTAPTPHPRTGQGANSGRKKAAGMKAPRGRSSPAAQIQIKARSFRWRRAHPARLHERRQTCSWRSVN